MRHPQAANPEPEQRGHQGELWRSQIAARVAAHKARRSGDGTSQEESCHPGGEGRRRSDTQQLTQRAVDNVRRKIEERVAREEAERREREDLERFFAEFNTPVVPAEPVQPTTRKRSAGAEAMLVSNVIEFPRGIMDAVTGMGTASTVETAEPDQLTIFEAMPELEQEFAIATPLRLPALRLDEHVDFASFEDEEVDPEAQFDLPLKVASFSRRAWAGMIDWTLVGGCACAFVSIFYGIQHELPRGKSALAVSILAVWVMWTIYQLMFLVYSGSTPGMRVMRLGISDFEDRVPDSRTRIKRALALLCTLMSCGIGFFWALLDEDRLGWHDRMTRTFPRPLA